ncbi:unnamed protein product, partial [Tetraodon nigroviridis]
VPGHLPARRPPIGQRPNPPGPRRPGQPGGDRHGPQEADSAVGRSCSKYRRSGSQSGG